MRLSGLQFDNIPALNIPFRFYLTAPIFAILTGVLLIFWGEQIWLSRWMPITLATTHLIALGVVAMIMFGSLFQLLPVLCGTPIPINSKGAIVFISLLSFGILCLSAAFLQQLSFLPALFLLSISLLSFGVILIYTLWFNASGFYTRTPVLLAVIMLALTIILGFSFLLNYQTGYFGALPKYWTNIHAAFGTLGWVTLLIITISFQVIPMFHVTPEFPVTIKNHYPFGLFILLISLAIELLFSNSHVTFALIATLLATYAIAALKQLSLRKRKLPDTTIKFWQLSLSSLLVCSFLLVVNLFTLSSKQLPFSLDSIIGVIFVVGVVLSVIQGMLLKIVPFLITLHLQQHAMKYPMGMGLMPDHYAIISRQHGKQLYWIHLGTLVIVVMSAFIPSLTKLVGILFIINWGFLWLMISRAYNAFSRIKLDISNA
ncbi:hypothetical protein HII17_03455 [Thalassotalea sp. M1531]|uniref:Uncharacterized protein n=1 Tax=Thalassotalea algicola TaxID=2716224 RepID=A0A7Y0L9T2_9GAMM|nr:hypothetical protein [Thalassotalea algicola]NMP30609.1 hypothetical protein [Thalassotalea algicola]